MKLLRFIAIGAVLLLLSVVPLFGISSKTATMLVKGVHQTIVNISTTDIDFGTFSQVSGVISADATVTVQASVGLPYWVTLDDGLNGDGTSRYIASGASKIPYIIYKPDWSAQWGDNDFSATYPPGSSVSWIGDGTNQNFAAHGQMNAANAAGLPNDIYTDTIMITIYY